MNSLLASAGALGAPERTRHRPNAAPAYYLGRPAGVFMGAIHPKRTATACIRSDGGGDRAASATRAEARQ